MSLNKVSLLLIFGLILPGCGTGGDYTKKLSGDYFFRSEGKSLNDILSQSPNGGEIPANVIGYTYNESFIIAKQKPRIPQDILYEKNYVYENGKDQTYFWLILVKDEVVLGPMDNLEFEKIRNKYEVPEDLKLKPVN